MATAYQYNPVHSEIHARINQLERDFLKLSIAELCRRVDSLRGFAGIRGFPAVAELSGGLSDELARAGRAATVRPYLMGMREAADCDPADRAAPGIYLAAVAARLG